MSNRLIYILAGVIFVCIAGLVYQYSEIHALQLEVSENRAAVEQATNEAAAMLAKLESQEARIKSLEKAPYAGSDLLKLPSADKVELIQPGIYTLQTNTPFDPDAEATPTYEITHIVMEMRYEDYGTKLHVGMAASGWIPKGVYFDYDNDGRIDTEMAMNFVRDIPVVGRKLANAYDADLAQNLYSIFVSEAENAEYTSIDDMEDDAEAASSYVWKFVMDKYDAIEAWVLESLQEQEPNEDS